MDPRLVTQSLPLEEAQEYFLRVGGRHVTDILQYLSAPNQPESFKFTSGGFHCTMCHSTILSYLTNDCIPSNVKAKLNTFGQYSGILEHSRDGPTTLEAIKYFSSLLREIAKVYNPRNEDIGSPLGFDRTLAYYLEKYP